MAEPTLQQVFGTGASQTASTITISKADLTQLFPSATNRAEELLVALLLKAGTYLTDANRQLDPANVNVSIVAGTPTFITSNQLTFRRDSLNVLLYKLDAGSSITPADY